MAGKKTCLTHKKSGETTKKQTPTGLSARKFANLAQAYTDMALTCTTEDSNHEEYTFSVGDAAYIKHQDLEDDVVASEEDYWIGSIQEIRADNADDGWVRVQWYWSPQDVAEFIKSFDPTCCGDREMLFSDNCDIISAYRFVGKHVNVKRFDEKSIHQVTIKEDEWFFRYEFQHIGRQISPEVTHVACPICKIPYTPGQTKILHFCPRPSCCNFYHQSCLVKHGYVEETRTHRVLETWPDIDRTASVEVLCRICPSPPRKRKKKDHSTSKESDNDPLAGLPPLLVAIAGQQIVRGTKGGGIVGNIAPVTAARRLIFNTLKGDGVIPDDWATSLDISAAFLGADKFPNCICPNCYSPI